MKTFSKEPEEQNFRSVHCAVCGASETKRAWKKPQYNFVKCASCGLVYQNPQPVVSELLGRYDSSYFDYEIENEEAFFRLMILGLKDVGFFQKEEDILSRYRKIDSRPVFLDVGCATGRLLFEMRERGWNVQGVEICLESADHGIKKRSLDIKTLPLEKAGFKENSIDVLHCSHLIEHLTAPGDFVSEAARILKPGGLLIITTPDVAGFQSRLFGPAWRSAIADHMYLFSFRSLGRLLKERAFRIEKKVSWGGLAVGTASESLKRVADRLAKVFNIGDVMCIMATNIKDTID